MITNEPYSLVK